MDHKNIIKSHTINSGSSCTHDTDVFERLNFVSPSTGSWIRIISVICPWDSMTFNDFILSNNIPLTHHILWSFLWYMICFYDIWTFNMMRCVMHMVCFMIYDVFLWCMWYVFLFVINDLYVMWYGELWCVSWYFFLWSIWCVLWSIWCVLWSIWCDIIFMMC